MNDSAYILSTSITALHCTALQYTAMHCNTLQYTVKHITAHCYTTQFTILHTAIPNVSLHCTFSALNEDKTVEIRDNKAGEVPRASQISGQEQASESTGFLGILEDWCPRDPSLEKCFLTGSHILALLDVY